ncbi:cytochrome c [Roseovarius faecimaris]|uniref:Cytochrome c n=1 Tax=Roseovarius faecimaris TaxID=2494550 RepID=A0A6I6IXU8_9RHOB|nr:cytochrome c [Roseovarius faecimaris]QGY00317.1 cytochrome c [Roseovarius faecimaris]
MKIKSVTVLLACLAGAAHAADGDAMRGEDTFQRHCAVCHGLEATGHGPMVTVLTIPPPDLTRLSARNDGTFPMTRVVTRIDGRDPLVSHGSPMPVYGDFFEGRDVMLPAETGQPIATSQPIADLVAYLQGLQQTGD